MFSPKYFRAFKVVATRVNQKHIKSIVYYSQ